MRDIIIFKHQLVELINNFNQPMETKRLILKEMLAAIEAEAQAETAHIMEQIRLEMESAQEQINQEPEEKTMSATIDISDMVKAEAKKMIEDESAREEIESLDQDTLDLNPSTSIDLNKHATE